MRRYLFIIGAQRSGTTLFAKGLDARPDVEFAKPLRPEPKYLLRGDAEISAEDYERRYFPGLPYEVLRAEKSTSYIEHPMVAKQMVRHFPGSRAIALLRDPVERAVSNYWFSVEHGFETRSPEEALDPALEWDTRIAGVSVSPFAYLKRGRYLAHLDAYAKVIGRDNLLVLQTERLVSDERTWAEVSAFLDVQPKPVPSSVEWVNGSRRQRPVAEATLDSLAVHFAPHNRALAARYGIDLRLWRAPG